MSVQRMKWIEYGMTTDAEGAYVPFDQHQSSLAERDQRIVLLETRLRELLNAGLELGKCHPNAALFIRAQIDACAALATEGEKRE